MPSQFSHPSYIGWLEVSLAQPADVPLPAADIEWHSIRAANRACCCAGRPAVVVIVPPSQARDHATELLLCVHHFSATADTLDAAGYEVYDTCGSPLIPTH